jgi:L-malate glycosyltransferase
MKICFLGDGGSIHILRWIDYFVKKDHEVHLISFTDFKDINNLSGRSNFHIHKIGNFNINSGGGNWRYLLSLQQVKNVLKEIKPDIVNAHYITSYGFLAALLGIKKLVLSAWGSDILVAPGKSKLYEFITKFALRKAKLITSDSEYMSSIIRELVKNEVMTVPMGVEEGLCKLDRQINNDEVTILSLRTIDKNCNINSIVGAFYQLCKKYNNARLIITNNGPEIDNIKKLVGDLNLEDKVDFMGFISRDTLIDLLLKSQVYVSIPDSDSTSVTLLEAMASGIIPIVSNIPANCEWIKSNSNGLILENKNDFLLYELFVEALENKRLKENCLIKNREIILKKAIWKDNMTQVENKYIKIVTSN